MNKMENKIDTKIDEPKPESEKIWEEIKDLPINMYALPDRMIHQHVVRKPSYGDELILQLTSTAVLPALENVLMSGKRRYTVEIASDYIIVRRTSERDFKIIPEKAPVLIVR